MSALYALCAMVALALLVHLVAALLNPEDFT
jgi:K+-transporting ATPase KdpF subunit